MERIGRSTALLIAMGLCLLSLSFVWRHLTRPSDGIRLGPEEPFGDWAWTPDGILATPLEYMADGVHQNDLIVAIDGSSIESWTEALTAVSFPRPIWQVGQVVIYTVVRDGMRIDVPVTLRPYPLQEILSRSGTLPFVAIVCVMVTGYIFWRRWKERATMPLFLWSICMLSAVLSVSVGSQTSDIVDGVGFWLFKITTFGAAIIGVLCILSFALVFPQPHPTLTRHARLMGFVCLAPLMAYAVWLVILRLQTPSLLRWIGRWNSTWPVLIFVYMGLMLVVLLSNYQYARRNPVAWQQGRLVVAALVAMSTMAIPLGLLPKILLGHTLIDRNILAFMPLMILVAVARAILRYRLFDIDVIINRTLVYTTLTALVIVLYGLIVGLLSEVLQLSGNFYISLVATGCIAVLFQPLRERLHQGVNRLMYGERDDPYAILTHLVQRIDTVLAPDAILPTIVETVAHALKLPYVAIYLTQGDAMIPAASYGLLKGKRLCLPLIH